MKKEKALDLVAARKRQLLQARRAQTRANERFEAAALGAARAGATQREIAAQAGVSQPYVARILARSERFALSGPIGKRLVQQRDRVLAILREYGAENVRVFGSVARGDERSDSDLDLIVDLGPGTGLFTLGRIERDLEQLLGVDVDLIPSRLLAPKVASCSRGDVVKL